MLGIDPTWKNSNCLAKDVIFVEHQLVLGLYHSFNSFLWLIAFHKQEERANNQRKMVETNPNPFQHSSFPTNIDFYGILFVSSNFSKKSTILRETQIHLFSNHLAFCFQISKHTHMKANECISFLPFRRLQSFHILFSQFC